MPPNARSRGYATLSVVSILTLIFSALALSSARHVITDSHAMRNQVLAQRALAAADGGIEHGLAWLGAIDSATGSSHLRLLAGSWSVACDPATDPSPATNSRTLTTQIDEHEVEISFTAAGMPWNCRGQSIVLTGLTDDLGYDIPEPPSLVPDARDVFDQLTPAEQQAIMGPRRLDLFRNGDIGWDEMTTTRSTDGWRDSYGVRPLGDIRAATPRPAA